ncbi:MAG: hypothetical protein PHX25_03235 [Candidatus Pacebacteria bacterium]|nr:hypothetical protein [Candidatus Paceibacterota bacterium]
MLSNEERETKKDEEEKTSNSLESFIQDIPPEERKIAEAYLHAYN